MKQDWAREKVENYFLFAIPDNRIEVEAEAIRLLKAERARARRIVRAVMKESTMSGFADLACRVILKRLG